MANKLRIGQATCPFCKYVTTTGGISLHVLHCDKNPDFVPRERMPIKKMTLKQFNKLTGLNLKTKL